MANSIKKSMFWKLMERGFTQGMLLVLTIVLARLMDPEDFGTLTLLMVFVSLMQVFLDSGMGSALIQKKNVTDLEYSTVFYFNLVVCVILYLVMFALAPIVARVYHEEAYTQYIRVLSIIILISGLRNIQNTKAAINMDFKRLFFSAFFGVVISGVIGITLAYKGFGIWALIIQNIINVLVATIVLWLIDRWIPARQFSLDALRGLWGYGWKIFLASLIMNVYDNLSVLIIGKRYIKEDLAFYDQGRKYPQVIISNINASVDSVIFPAMSKKQDDPEGLAELTKKTIMTTEYVLLPIMTGLAVCSHRIVNIVLTEKWLPCVPYICLFCFFYLLYPFNTANLNVLKAVGRSNRVLKLEVIKRCLGLIILMLTLRYGVFAIACGMVVSGVIDWTLNAHAARSTLKYGLLTELKVILPSVFMSMIMAVGVYACGMLKLNSELVILILQVLVGIVIYAGLSIVTKNEVFKLLLNSIIRR